MFALASNTARYTELVQRLNRASVHKHAEAYIDIDWDAPEFRIDPEDPRWELDEQDPLGATGWYRARKPALRARIGLDTAAARAKLGIEFEAILSRGLLSFAASRPNGSVDARYAFHELIEEGQHSLMFQEFVNRAGGVAQGLSGWQAWAARGIPPLGRSFPELFFCYVLSGEVPIDQVQRGELRSPGRHPLLRRIMQIHVTEEARHVCFAEQYLAEHVPRLPRLRLAQLRVMLPFITAETSKLMLRPPSWLLRRHAVPAVIAADAKFASRARAFGADCVRPLMETYRKLGLITTATLPLWHAVGLQPALPALDSGEPRLLGR